jgi:hypothetical protein
LLISEKKCVTIHVKNNHSLAKVAELNGVESAQVQFTVPAPAQKMEEKFRLQANFFKN